MPLDQALVEAGQIGVFTAPLPLGSGYRTEGCSQGGSWLSSRRRKSQVRRQERSACCSWVSPTGSYSLRVPGSLDGRAPGLRCPARGQTWSRNLDLPLGLVSTMLWKPLPWSRSCLSSSPTLAEVKDKGDVSHSHYPTARVFLLPARGFNAQLLRPPVPAPRGTKESLGVLSSL